MANIDSNEMLLMRLSSWTCTRTSSSSADTQLHKRIGILKHLLLIRNDFFLLLLSTSPSRGEGQLQFSSSSPSPTTSTKAYSFATSKTNHPSMNCN